MTPAEGMVYEARVFASRAEFIRDAVRRHLERHAEAVQGALEPPVGRRGALRQAALQDRLQ